MPHPLKVEGRATLLFLLMTLNEKDKSFILSGIQHCFPQPIYDHSKNKFLNYGPNPYRFEYLITLFDPRNELLHTMPDE